MNQLLEANQINEAITRFVQTGWTKDVERAMTDAYGPRIMQRVKDVYDTAMDCPVNWKIESMDSALGILADYLTEKYPWLSSEARKNLNYCYIMVWK